ncbi:hypothetical protein ANCDUO_05944 [Ancylostoma duodenale]|uniref:Uncharacterized protein n=1 Tax=Ancylostoma duodenale TaxID=51022 RepID=A0A0C2H2T0_9BILA|nr:hypothetical protein ANCDUO_05944 [Ancylostoma duodenale]
MLLIWAAAIGLVAAGGYDTQAGGYETAENNQPKPSPPVSAGNGDQQAYNSDGAGDRPPTYDAPKGYGKPSGGHGKPGGGYGKPPSYPAPAPPSYPAPSPTYPGPQPPHYPSTDNGCGQQGQNDQPAPGGGDYRRRFRASRRF